MGIASSYLFLQVAGAMPSRTRPFRRVAPPFCARFRSTTNRPRRTTSSGAIKWLYDWDDAGADEEFRRGRSIDPDVDDFAYGTFLSAKGRHAEAIVEMERAIAVNPGKVSTHIFYSGVLADAGRLDEALREALKYAGRAGALGHTVIGDTFLRMGRLPEAESWYQRAAGDGVPVPGLLAVLVRTGRRADADRLFRRTVALEGEGRAQATDVAQMAAILGRKDDAFRWLDKALAARSGSLRSLSARGFLLDSLRDDPRWADLQRRIAAAGPPK